MRYVIELLAAFFGSIGFSLLFNIKKDKLFASGLGGLLTWGIYLITTQFISSDAVCFFICSICLSFYAEILAKIKKAPATIFLVAASIPLIPGGSLYHTMRFAVEAQWNDFATQGLYTLSLALAIAIGMLFGMSVMKGYNRLKN